MPLDRLPLRFAVVRSSSPGYDPRAMVYQFLSLDQLAIIASTEPTVTAAALARQFDRSYGVVVQAVRRIRRAGGWYSPITWRACTECGQAVASGPHGVRTAHADCEHARDMRYDREYRERYPGRKDEHRRQWAQRNPEAWAAYCQRARERRAPLPAERNGASRSAQGERNLLDHGQAEP